MEPQPIDDLIHRLALGAEGDSNEIEIRLRHGDDHGAIGLVVIRREELVCIDRWLNAARVAGGFPSGDYPRGVPSQ